MTQQIFATIIFLTMLIMFSVAKYMESKKVQPRNTVGQWKALSPKVTFYGHMFDK